jgi:hypothetical protein
LKKYSYLNYYFSGNTSGTLSDMYIPGLQPPTGSLDEEEPIDGTRENRVVTNKFVLLLFTL